MNVLLKAALPKHIKICKRSSHNQQIHPEYIDDYVGTIESGFGNTMYRTFFAHLYGIEKEREPIKAPSYHNNNY